MAKAKTVKEHLMSYVNLLRYYRALAKAANGPMRVGPDGKWQEDRTSNNEELARMDAEIIEVSALAEGMRR